ncbi:MAG: LPS-assembly protein LptD [Rhodoferax sp.]|uniref:LPS-assembly protein LptD n=1 Tax=Rhodoferax sp. TaxID=50421 RepID=UPI00262FD48C|nr:LPS-assembly protein LptD [Rhodoferax sp.]MDD2880761.1 LPS-assembly protein LptD [Rhodoferax sp.]
MRDTSLLTTPSRFALAPVCLSVALLQSSLAGAQLLGNDPLQLQPSPLLQEQLSPQVRSSLPTFVSGQRITGRPDLETVVEGDAMLRKGDIVIKADRLEYDQPTDLAKAIGHVLVNRAGNVYEGPLLELRVDAFEGFFNEPTYHFLRNDAHGQASRVDFVDDQRAVIHNATYTTCRRLPGPSWMPDWILKASTISLDNEEDVGTASGALLSFKGVPVLPVPFITFPLSDKRKSGVLPPTLGLDNVNGTEVSLPYYWNIAPNRDATLTPTVMTKRGVNLGTEFRYLEDNYAGTANVEWMPFDQLRDSSRWGLNINHQARIKSAWTDNGAALNLSLNRVSDDNYWRDFTRTNSSLTQRLLANDATLAWTNGAWANSVRTLKWQTLQDVTAPIVPPYDRLPQLATRYTRSNLAGMDVALDADYTRFQSDGIRTGQPNAERTFSLLQASRVFQSSAGYITPKVQLHATNYQFDAPLKDGAMRASRVVPTLSVDTGVVFERDTQLFGRALRQTLEPRAFYVNTPYRDQSLLPNYDSGANDFNLSTIYSENAFVGNDRISDSNLLTIGVTSRFLDPATGAENARIGVAQRLRFQDQNVTLPGGLPAQDRISDMLWGGSINWDPRWRFDGTVQFNPDTQQSVRSTLGARYNPGRYRTLSAAYRYQRDLSEQLDVGWQWPINDLWGDRGQKLNAGQGQGEGRWYSVGRLNYSMNERKLVDSVLGLEYDAGCWLGRMVWERLQTSSVTATQRIMFQLEFVGFSRLGVNPLKSLKDNIPNYQYLREPSVMPSRFSNYD